MDISIIVPVYNAEQWLDRCVSSLLNQNTSAEYEIILVDDGSKDRSGIICDQFSRDNKTVTAVHKKNEGCLAARLTGLENAAGRYIWFVDSDDWVEQNSLERLYAEMKQNNPDIIMFNTYMDFGEKSERDLKILERQVVSDMPEKEKLYSGALYNGRPFERSILASLCTKIFRRNLIADTLTLVDKRISIGEDASITYPALMQADCIVKIPETLYHYVQNEASMTHRYARNYPLQAKLLYHHLTETMKNDHGYDFTWQIEGNYISMIVSAISNLFQTGAPAASVQRAELYSICADQEIHRIMQDFDYHMFSKKEQVVCFLLKHHCSKALFVYESMIQLIKKLR